MNLTEFTKAQIPVTDKYTLGYMDEFYNDLLTPRKETAETVLEIGIHNGYSIALWKNYFTNAVIHGVDINTCDGLHGQDRILLHYENAYSQSFVNKFTKESFDIVIDDGPHTFESMVFFLQNYISLVKHGGVLILEDIIDQRWTPELLKLIDPAVGKITVVDMRNKQKTPHLLSLWQHGLDVIIVEKY